MADKTTNEAQSKDYKISTTVKLLTLSPKDKNRFNVECFDEFDGYDENENPCKTKKFGIHWFNLQQQIAGQIPELDLALTLAMGQPLNKKIFALCLQNAKLQADRVHHLKGEERKAQKEGEPSKTYEGDTYTTENIRVIANISPIAQQVIMKLIENSLLDETSVTTTTTTAVNYNPFL